MRTNLTNLSDVAQTTDNTHRRTVTLVALLLLAACGAEPAAAPAAPPTTATSCGRSAADPNRTRAVLVSYPFSATNVDFTGNSYALWQLSANGALTAAPAAERFSMERASNGSDIIFTPDGELAFVLQDDGSVGVVRINGDLSSEVLYPALRDGFYASAIAVDPSGDWLWVTDVGNESDGGGLYRLAIGCDGVLGSATRVLAGDYTQAMRFVDGSGSSAVLAARSAAGSAAPDDLHLLAFAADAQGAPVPTVIAGASAFAGASFVAAAMAVSADASYVIVANNALDATHEVVVLALDSATIGPVLQRHPLFDPSAIAVSPDNEGLLLLSGEGDSMLHSARLPDPTNGPYAAPTALLYTGNAPQLPLAAKVVTRGNLAGLVLIAENLGVRRARFVQNGGAIDIGVVSSGSGIDAIVGTVGVQP